MCLPPTRICYFFHFFECTIRFARFFRLCLSKSNQIRPEQQRQDQATSEELRLVWSKAKQYRNNLTSLNVSYALRDTFISGSQWTIQRSQDNFRAFHRSSVQLTTSQSKPNEMNPARPQLDISFAIQRPTKRHSERQLIFFLA